MAGQCHEQGMNAEDRIEAGNHAGMIAGAGLQNRNAQDAKPARTAAYDNPAYGNPIKNSAYKNSINGKSVRMDDSQNRGAKRKKNVIYPLSEVIRGFKTFSALRMNELRGIAGIPVWQRNYWDRIVRNDKALQIIRKYIINNPARWERDRMNKREERAGRRGQI